LTTANCPMPSAVNICVALNVACGYEAVVKHMPRGVCHL